MFNCNSRRCIESLESRRFLTSAVSLSEDLLAGPAHPQSITAVGDEVYFFADVGAKSNDTPAATITQQLWKSDGTSKGTVRITSKLAPSIAYPGPATAVLDGLF